MSNSSRGSSTKNVFYIHAARKLERDQKLTMQGTVGRLFFTSRLSLRAAWNYERKALRTETLATHVSQIEARQSLYQHRLTVFADNRVRHMICLSQSAYYSLRQKCGSHILDLELDSLTERVTNSESTRNKNMITAFKYRSGSCGLLESTVSGWLGLDAFY